MVIIGIFLILLIIWDVLYTTLVHVGAGPVSFFITRITWKIFFYISGKRGTSPVLKFCEAFTIFLVFCVWISLYWTGHALIVLSNYYSVLDSTTNEPIHMWGEIYFTGVGRMFKF